jgi:hypothetical protein
VAYVRIVPVRSSLPSIGVWGSSFLRKHKPQTPCRTVREPSTQACHPCQSPRAPRDSAGLEETLAPLALSSRAVMSAKRTGAGVAFGLRPSRVGTALPREYLGWCSSIRHRDVSVSTGMLRTT